MVDAVHSEQFGVDDWPDAITAAEYAAAKGCTNQLARHRLNRMAESNKLEKKTVMRPNSIGKMTSTSIYRVKK